MYRVKFVGNSQNFCRPPSSSANRPHSHVWQSSVLLWPVWVHIPILYLLMSTTALSRIIYDNFCNVKIWVSTCTYFPHSKMSITNLVSATWLTRGLIITWTMVMIRNYFLFCKAFLTHSKKKMLKLDFLRTLRWREEKLNSLNICCSSFNPHNF